MEENKAVGRNDEIEIDLQRVFSAILKKAWIVMLASVVCAVVAFLITFFFITPKYKSSAMFYVNNSKLSVGDISVGLSSSDIVASKYLVDSYIVILESRTTLNDVIDYAGVDRTYLELLDMVEAESVEETEIFRITVTSEDPVEAEQIANAIAYILPKRISSIIEGTSSKVVDAAIVASTPSSPSMTKNTLIGFAMGFLISVGIIVLHVIFDITIRAEEDIEQVCKHPILASVPDMAVQNKGGYYSYGYGGKPQSTEKVTANGREPILVGSGIGFAASEAYKLLRTKIQFSFADDNNCRVIGVTSALTGEGKSLSSVNLAYTLSQLDKRVLLIDCDMRRPSLATKLPLERLHGLSSYLSGQSHMDTLIQKCGLQNEEDAFDVVWAGRNPPNPMELLSSARMVRMLNRLREKYDYIVLDFPPIGEVGDALALAGQIDGMLLVVRENYCNRVVLSDAIRQLEFVGAKVLGVVVNCVDEEGSPYTKKYYKKYSKYGYGYAAAAKNTSSKTAKKVPIERRETKTNFNKTM